KATPLTAPPPWVRVRNSRPVATSQTFTAPSWPHEARSLPVESKATPHAAVRWAGKVRGCAAGSAGHRVTAPPSRAPARRLASGGERQVTERLGGALEQAQLAARVGLPAPPIPSQPRPGGPLPGAVEGDGVARDGLAERLHLPRRAAVPDPDGPVRPGGGEVPAVAAESHGRDAARVGLQGEHLLARGDVPELDRVVVAPRGEAAVAAERQAGDDAAVPGQGSQQAPAPGVPEADLPARRGAAPRRQGLPLPADRQAERRPGVGRAQPPRRLPLPAVPDAHHAVQAAPGEAPAVRAPGQPLDRDETPEGVGVAPPRRVPHDHPAVPAGRGQPGRGPAALAAPAGPGLERHA